MSKLNLAFLWHQHQPYYKVVEADGRSVYQMPWVRMHAVKDYYDLPRLLDEFPAIRQNYNLVPSLLMQIEDYAQNGAEDHIIRLTRIRPSELSEAQREMILDRFFMTCQKRLIDPYPRYRALWEQREAKNPFSEQDLLDLQVWYNLCWIGESWRNQTPFKELFEKHTGFTEADKKRLIDGHYRIMREVVPIYRRLANEGRVELSVTPMYHPILPLLCDSDVARESDTNLPQKEFRFRFPQDAARQVEGAVSYFEEMFGFKPSGMWPSEGSVSAEAASIVRKAGLRWVATDQEILEHSDSDGGKDLCFPYTLDTRDGSLSLIFRDHALSDSIGFRYAEMDPVDAVNDFMGQVDAHRRRILDQGGDPSAHMLNVILDGENCWEYYPQNGELFLRELFRRLTESDTVTSVTISDFLGKSFQRPGQPKITRLHPGSWIRHNFDIWIGAHREKNTAWEWLRNARELWASRESHTPPETAVSVREAIAIAEGSDWFWWFGDDHHAHNKSEFDGLFRYHLRRVYTLLREPIPDALHLPIMADQNHSDHSHRPATYE